MNISKQQSKGKHIPYSYIDNGSKKVCFMLSGTGYTYENPLLYYATMQLMEAAYDIVHIHYSYSESQLKKGIDNLVPIVIEDVKDVVIDVLINKTYEEIIFLGKSFGTIPIAYRYCNNEYLPNVKLILLTPLFKLEGLHEQVMQCEKNMLIVIGTEDPHYSEQHMAYLRSKNRVTLIEIEGANHKVEIVPVNTDETLKVLTDVTRAIKEFITI